MQFYACCFRIVERTSFITPNNTKKNYDFKHTKKPNKQTEINFGREANKFLFIKKMKLFGYCTAAIRSNEIQRKPEWTLEYFMATVCGTNYEFSIKNPSPDKFRISSSAREMICACVSVRAWVCWRCSAHKCEGERGYICSFTTLLCAAATSLFFFVFVFPFQLFASMYCIFSPRARPFDAYTCVFSFVPFSEQRSTHL